MTVLVVVAVILSLLFPILWINQYSRETWLAMLLGRFEWVAPEDGLKLYFYVVPFSDDLFAITSKTKMLIMIETADKAVYFYDCQIQAKPSYEFLFLLWLLNTGTLPAIEIKSLMPTRYQVLKNNTYELHMANSRGPTIFFNALGESCPSLIVRG